MLKDSEYSNHSMAMDEIARELGVKREYVKQVMMEAFYRSLPSYLKYPYIVKFPCLGTFVPDMRRYRHFEKRQELNRKLKHKL